MDHRQHPLSRFDADDDHLDVSEIKAKVGQALADSFTELNPPNGSTIVIQNLTINVKIASINSARGGGATVNVNLIERAHVESSDDNDVTPREYVPTSRLPLGLSRFLPGSKN
jgi:hypothetical protein